MPLPTPPVDLNKPLPPLPLRAMPSEMARLEDPKYRAYQPLPRSQQQVPALHPRSRRDGMVFEQSDIDALNAALQNKPPPLQIRRKQVGSSDQPAAPKNRELGDHIATGGLGEATVHTSFFHHRSEGDSQTSVAHSSSTSRTLHPDGHGQTRHKDNLPACLRTGTGIRTGQTPDDLTMPLIQCDMISSEVTSQHVIEPTCVHPDQVTTGARPPPVSRNLQTTTTSRPLPATQTSPVARTLPVPGPPPMSHLPIVFRPLPVSRPQITNASRFAPLERWINRVQPKLARNTGDFFQRQRQRLRERLFDPTRSSNASGLLMRLAIGGLTCPMNALRPRPRTL